jgi:hypothetical protein
MTTIGRVETFLVQPRWLFVRTSAVLAWTTCAATLAPVRSPSARVAR